MPVLIPNSRYNTASGLSSVVAHDAKDRNAAEQQFIQANAEQMTMQALFTADKQARRSRALVQRKSSQVPQTGSPRVPVILVNYADKQFISSDPVATWTQQICAADEVSVYQYFVDQSFGKYKPQFEILGVVTLSQNRSYYGAHSGNSNDVRVGTMVAQACQGVESSVDWSRYDNDGDNVCDVVIVLYAGDGEASSYDDDAANAIWPCQWDLRSSDYRRNITLDGITISKFAVFNELYGADLTKLDGIGTMCHEFSHCLDLPDFYPTDYSNHFGMGDWSLLHSGCYNNNGYTPCGYTAYERNFMGWFDYTTPVENTQYTTASVQNGGQAFKITSDNDNEYYIVETIEQSGWNEYAPASGLQVTHVNYSATKWNNNNVNNSDTQGMTIIPADNSLATTQSGSSYYIDSSDEYGDLFPYNGVDELTSTSTPAATLYNSSTNLNKPITQITKNNDGTVTFIYMGGNIITPVATDATNVVSTSATANWNTCEEATSYTLRINPIDTDYEQVFRETFSGCDNYYTNEISSYFEQLFDNSGWTGSNIYCVTNGVCIGRAPFSNATGGDASSVGTLTSPAVSLSNSKGVATVAITGSTFYYSTYSESNCELTVTLGSQSQTVKFASGASETKYLTFECEENDSQTLTLATTATDKRVMVTDVTIYAGNAKDALTGATTNENTIIIEGITDNSYNITGLTPNTRYDYDVRAHYGDKVSKWSNVISFTTTEGAPEVSLADLVSNGNVDSEYTISNDLQVVAVVNGNTLLLKDDGEAVNKVAPTEGQENYIIWASSTFVDGVTSVNKTAQADYDQSNWIEVVTTSDVAGTVAVNDVIKGGSITGKYVDALNPRMELTSTSLSKNGTAQPYSRNAMTPANFVGSQKGNDGKEYFFMTPKPNEMVQVVWAVYSDGAFYCPVHTSGINELGFAGRIDVAGYGYNDVQEFTDDNRPANEFAYQFKAIVKAKAAQSAPRKAASTFGILTSNAETSYAVYPLNLAHTETIVTAIDGVNAQRGVASVKYYNLQGVQLDSMQPGINIIVTRYTDGSSSTVKVVK